MLDLSSGKESKGHAFYPSPVRMHKLAGEFIFSFSTTFVFTIIPEYPGLASHGIAFVLSSTNDYSDALPAQYLGLANVTDIGDSSNHFIAIELDTILNPEFGDIDDNHVGIDISSLISNSSFPAGYYDVGPADKFQNLRLSSGYPVQVWIDYNREADMRLEVTLAPFPMPQPKRPLLHSKINFSSVLSDSIYVGFSSSTGFVSTSHHILGWSFNLNGDAPPLNYSMLPIPLGKPRAKKVPSGILLPVTLPLLALLLAITACLVVRRLRKNRAGTLEDWEVELGPHRFPHKDLHRATNGFNNTQLLGRGGFGSVYKGVLPVTNACIAVKRISSESKQGMKQFVAEIVILGHLRHRNLVQLLGYCRQEGQLLLVYDYMPNGSLEKYLHDPTKPSLDWAQRFHIIKGVASGLLYLHEEWDQVIIHRDIKASNVLLDNEMNGRLGDFGLARLHDHGVDAHTTDVAGTRGYIALELTMSGKATKATDVFAFGVFILEVACGRRPIGVNAHGDLFVLVEWVRDMWEMSGSITDTMDPRLDDYVAGEAELVLKLGLLCSHPLPAARPGMRMVMQYLDGDTPLPEFLSSYLSIRTMGEIQNACPSVATTITSLSGGR